ncbi:hypothetical protein [Methylobacter sp.]|nr:hypothetical protein [Methylobacter sp.]
MADCLTANPPYNDPPYSVAWEQDKLARMGMLPRPKRKALT